MVTEDEEILVAGDDEVWPGCGSESEHGIIVGIAADLFWQRRRVEDFRQHSHLRQHQLRIRVGPSENIFELRTSNDFGQLRKQRRGTHQVSAPARTCPINRCGFPVQSRRDTSILVSMTARALPPAGTSGLHLRVDLLH